MKKRKEVPAYLWNPETGAKTLFKDEESYRAALDLGWPDNVQALAKAQEEAKKKPASKGK